MNQVQTVRDFAKSLSQRVRSNGLLVVGIDGPGGSGKSTIARALAAVCEPPGVVVEFDDFYLPSAERLAGAKNKPFGADFDWRRLRRQVLEPLAHGKPGRCQRYDWDEDALNEWHDVPPSGLVVIEGIYTTRRELSALYHLRIWVQTGRDIRLERGLARDGEEARPVWVHKWMPLEDAYMSEDAPAKRAHVIVDGSGGHSHNPNDSVVVIEDRR